MRGRRAVLMVEARGLLEAAEFTKDSAKRCDEIMAEIDRLDRALGLAERGAVAGPAADRRPVWRDKQTGAEIRAVLPGERLADRYPDAEEMRLGAMVKGLLSKRQGCEEEMHGRRGECQTRLLRASQRQIQPLRRSRLMCEGG